MEFLASGIVEAVQETVESISKEFGVDWHLLIAQAINFAVVAFTVYVFYFFIYSFFIFTF